MTANNWSVLAVAVIVIGFVGAFALLHPDTQAGELCIGALLPIAGGVGTYFFHTSSQGFLGTQLAAQRASFVSVMGATTVSPPAPTPSATSGTNDGASTTQKTSPPTTSEGPAG